MYDLPTFYHYENFDDVLGISLRCQFQRVSDYLLSKDDTMASFYINSQDDDIYEEDGCNESFKF